MVLPEAAVQWTVAGCSAQQTLGGGACGVHALLGVPNSSGMLECAGARGMAVESLSRSLACNSCVHAAILRESWWHELAVPAASGEAPTQEAKLLWSEFQARYPEGAERGQQQVEKEQAEKRRAQGGLGELREACRTFFKSVSHEGLLEVCARLDYASTEAQELCYEPRAGQYVVKGSGGLWPEGGPQTKLEAMIDCRAVFDELRLAVFLRCPCLVEVESSLRGSDIDKEACQAMAAAVAAFREAPQQTTGHTGSFLSEASATYLAIVQDPSYYFSCDEIALIARQRGLNVILAKELGRKQWVAEAVVHSGAGPFQAILLRGASGAGHVRTHFERLQRVANAGVADLTTERRHWWKCRVCSATFSSSILVPEGGVCCGHPVEEGVQQAGGPAGDAHAATLGQGPATPCEEPDARLPIPEWALPALRRKETEVAAEEADADSRSEAGSGPTEAAGLQDSGAERSGKPKREKLPFAHGTDGTCEFERAVDLVLETYRSGGAVHAVLQNLPHYSAPEPGLAVAFPWSHFACRSTLFKFKFVCLNRCKLVNTARASGGAGSTALRSSWSATARSCRSL